MQIKAACRQKERAASEERNGSRTALNGKITTEETQQINGVFSAPPFVLDARHQRYGKRSRSGTQTARVDGYVSCTCFHQQKNKTKPKVPFHIRHRTK